MNDELKALISKADCGDRDAQKELMERGDAASSAGDHEQAAFLYKMAAMAYRIAAWRGSTVDVKTTFEYRQVSWLLDQYRVWIAKYTKPVAPRFKMLVRKKMAYDASSSILALRKEEKFKPLVRYLEEQLASHGVEFCAPGGTINRHICKMAEYLEHPFWHFIHGVDTRVVLDPISDEIMYRVEHPEAEPKTAKRKKAGKKP
jgi:hypothetical protein